MKKIACILGILLSVALAVLGLSIMNGGIPELSGGTLTYDGSMSSFSTSSAFSGLTVSSTSFGADFYTYSYKATRAAANNIESLGEYIDDVMPRVLSGLTAINSNTYKLGSYLSKATAAVAGGALVVLGLFGFLLSLYGLGAAHESARQLELLDQIASQRTGTQTSPLAAMPYRAPAPVHRYSEGGDRWLCPACKHQNPTRLSNCDICGEPRPNADA